MEKEKEIQETKDGMLTYLKRIGILPGKLKDWPEGANSSYFERTFTEVVDDERLQVEMAGKQMGNEDFAFCLMKYFDIMVDRLEMKYICQGIINGWSKQSKKAVKNKMFTTTHKAKKSFYMPKGQMSISPRPKQEPKPYTASKMDDKIDKIINPSLKKLICKPPIQTSAANSQKKLNQDRLSKSRPTSPLLIAERPQEPKPSEPTLQLAKTKSTRSVQRSLSRPHARAQNAKGMKINFKPGPVSMMEDRMKQLIIKGGTKTSRSPEHQ